MWRTELGFVFSVIKYEHNLLFFLCMRIPKRAQNSQEQLHRELLWFFQVFTFYIALLALLFSLFSFAIAFFWFVCRICFWLSREPKLMKYFEWLESCPSTVTWASNLSCSKPLLPLGKNSLVIALLVLSAFIAYLHYCFCFGTRTISNFILTMPTYQIKLQHCSGQENKRPDSNMFMIEILQFLG